MANRTAQNGPDRYHKGVAPETTTLKVADGDGGQRLDKYLRKRFPGVPLSHVFQLLRKGDVRVNGARSKDGDLRLQDGDEVVVRVPGKESWDPHGGVDPQTLSFRGRIPVVFEDDDLLVLDKPAGMAVHPGTGVKPGRTVIEMVQAEFPDAGFPPALVHRLDKGTSGVLLLAYNRPALVRLQEEIRTHRARKTYLALAQGSPRQEAGTVDSRLARIDSAHGGAKAIVAREDSGREACTHWKVVRRLGGYALLEVTIDTGRMHQIRAHLASIGLPIVGDDRYHPDPDHRTFGLKRPFLHAFRMEIRVQAGKTRRFEAALPKDLDQALNLAESAC
jgi:23S rRNA pseudouridine955/2504/2580 synthase